VEDKRNVSPEDRDREELEYLKRLRIKLGEITNKIAQLEEERDDIRQEIKELARPKVEEPVSGEPGKAEGAQRTDLAEKILVVDDVKMMRMILMRILNGEGYTVYEAESGASALELLECSSVDLIILDIKMPDMDGFELVRRLRSDEKFANLPVIICSHIGDKTAVVQAAKFGVQGFITKPIVSKVILEKVETVLAGVYQGEAPESADEDE